MQGELLLNRAERISRMLQKDSVQYAVLLVVITMSGMLYLVLESPTGAQIGQAIGSIPFIAPYISGQSTGAIGKTLFAVLLSRVFMFLMIGGILLIAAKIFVSWLILE